MVVVAGHSHVPTATIYSGRGNAVRVGGARTCACVMVVKRSHAHPVRMHAVVSYCWSMLFNSQEGAGGGGEGEGGEGRGGGAAAVAR